MATQFMTETSGTSATLATETGGKSRRHEPSVREIVEKARAVPTGAIGGAAAAIASSVLLWASFTPLDWGWLGWIALAPLCLLVRIERTTRAMYRLIFAAGFAWSLVTLQWMRLGDAAMYPAWAALAFYMALYFPAFVGISRAAVHRLRIPLLIAVPLAWTGLEYVRANLMTGFAWYLLGHTQYAWTEIIQISDILGAYGVSFVVAMGSACVALTIPEPWLIRLRLVRPATVPTEFEHLPPDGMLPQAINASTRLRWVPVIATLSVVAATLAYGIVRRHQAQFREGPRVALIQGNFTSSLKHDPAEAPHIFRTHDFLTGQAVRHQPDLIVWPETMFRWPLQTVEGELSERELLALMPPVAQMNRYKWVESWSDSSVRRTLAEMSQRAGAAMFVGLEAWTARHNGLAAHNSAAFVTPQAGLVGRYDKLHRVVFGEYIPLKEELPWLHKLTPFPDAYGIAQGESARVFEYGGWKFAPIICFEDTVPHLVRRIDQQFAHEVDVYVNLTNDGWFQGSSELDQHLITAAFRAVECRTPMVRAVNTGISAVIDGDGVVVEPRVLIDGDAKSAEQSHTGMRDPQTGRWRKSLNAALIADVPLDNRSSLYAAYGDWFASLCCFATVFVACMAPFRGRRA